MPVIDHKELRNISFELLKAVGASNEESEIIARHCIDANLVGHDSHGIIQIPTYIDRVERGHIVPGAEIEILKGLGKYFPLLLKIEVQIVPMYESVPDWSELVNYLHKLNYMTCEWSEIGTHATHSPAEIDMLFIPNYLNNSGKELIMSRKKEFISLMLIFGQIKLLQIISNKLNFVETPEIENLRDKFFY